LSRTIDGKTEDVLSLSVVIPVYNEEINLNLVYERLKNSVDRIAKEYEFIFVDDGSSDNSFDILKQIRLVDKKVKVIRFQRNFGQHAALRAGFCRSRGKVVVFMDADLQTDPNEIGKLLEEHAKGYEVVCGFREKRKDPLVKKFLSTAFLSVASRLLGGEAFKNVSSFVLYDGTVIQALNRYLGRSQFITGWASRMGFNSSNVRIRHYKRLHGRSKYNLGRLYNLFVDVLSAFTVRHLYVVCVFGLMTCFANFIFGFAFVWKKFMYDYALEGFTSLIVMLNLLYGTEIFFIGVIGMYLAVGYRSLIGMPPYVVQKMLDGEVE
jgi:glycosyltransferase involved in cell wall biosynthesis